MGLFQKSVKQLFKLTALPPTNNYTHRDHVAEILYKTDPTINTAEMGPKIYPCPEIRPNYAEKEQ